MGRKLRWPDPGFRIAERLIFPRRYTSAAEQLDCPQPLEIKPYTFGVMEAMAMNQRIPRSILSGACLLVLLGVETRAIEPCVPHDDLSQFVCRFGKPDVDDSTEYDRPRPSIVTRMLTYKKEGVRAAYIPDANMGDQPPYEKWKLIGFQDPKTDAVLSAQEVVRRLQARDTKK
jgi:hypothetical protein